MLVTTHISNVHVVESPYSVDLEELKITKVPTKLSVVVVWNTITIGSFSHSPRQSASSNAWMAYSMWFSSSSNSSLLMDLQQLLIFTHLDDLRSTKHAHDAITQPSALFLLTVHQVHKHIDISNKLDDRWQIRHDWVIYLPVPNCEVSSPFLPRFVD